MSKAESCDTFVALASVTTKKCIIFGKNSDRPEDEVQEVVFFPAADHAAGAKVQCTYIEIDQVPHTHAVILSKPAWLWGAEMGANEKDVVIGNEAVWTTELDDNDQEERLLGMDFIRLALERADSAKGALDVIADLLQKHGQGGACYEDADFSTYHNSFIIADRSEAWVLETAGKHWAAEKVQDNVRNISNQLSIHSKIDAMSDGLQEHAKSKGYWDGSGEFDFAKCFDESASVPSGRYVGGKELMTAAAEGGNFNIKSMMQVLRNKERGICMVGGGSVTTGSMISVLGPVGSNTPSCHWFTATPNPSCSVFKPFIFCDGVKIGSKTTAPTFGTEDPVKVQPRFRKQVDRRHALYKGHTSLNPLPGNKVNGALLDLLQDMEEECVEEVDNFLAGFDESKVHELQELFEDIVDSEMKFYQSKAN